MTEDLFSLHGLYLLNRFTSKGSGAILLKMWETFPQKVHRQKENYGKLEKISLALQ